MSDNLKKAFNEKMHVDTTKHFDMDFKRKLEQTKKSNKIWTTRWYTFGAAGSIALMLFLFVFKQHFNFSYKNSAYATNIIKMDQETDDLMSEETDSDSDSDLTSLPTDEI